MEIEPRLRTCGTLAAVLVGLAVLFDSAIVLLGASALCGWLLARHHAFATELERTLSALSIEQSLDRTTVRTGATVQQSLAATLSTPSELSLTLEGDVPPAATLERDASTITLTPGMSAARVSQPLSWPVAGRHEFEGTTITATDGLFRQTITLENTHTITVRADPATINATATAGTQFAGVAQTRSRLGTHGQPAYAREYVPGDSLEQIDWKATARLGTTYVREFETETTHPERLVVDHRNVDTNAHSALVTNALAVVSRAMQASDPIGLLILDDDGRTTSIEPSATNSTHQTVWDQLTALEAGSECQSPSATEIDAYHLTGDRARQHLAALERSSASTGRESNNPDPFVSQLRPFYEEQARAVGEAKHKVESLADALRVCRPTTSHERTTILSVGTQPTDLHTAVSVARRRGDVVVGLVTDPHTETGTYRHTRGQTATMTTTTTTTATNDTASTDTTATTNDSANIADEDTRLSQVLAREDNVTVTHIRPPDQTPPPTVSTRQKDTLTRGEHR
ncbi:DUF58 domain-containing protein [Natronolimnobius sp. AArcel1]|uniref:DUF58 domain-containing protein n=1 Tax=Natronolimnobius sp. AArcel1 TaxID=1679093 RepID=UPI0013EDEE27|nr:DUF58 domain-containing protein [Natronolimnobius sp. AArcel1]NGM70339.1 DUF58 domain-containing protein [Natronolimnobius sp. AArcel1]